MTDTLTVRLSWVTYVRPALRIAVFATALFFYVAYLDDVRRFVMDMMPGASATVRAIAVALPVLLLVLGVFRAVWKIFLNRSIVLTVAPEGVAYRGGILPWKRWERYWRYHQIFNVLYSNRPEFLGWLLRFGDLVIVGREGSTREYRIAGIHDPRRVQVLISSRAEG